MSFVFSTQIKRAIMRRRRLSQANHDPPVVDVVLPLAIVASLRIHPYLTVALATAWMI
jgi:hypothetical protein